MSADYSSFGLKDKIAIVTGASQGIGKAIALGLAQAGAHLVLAKHPQGRQEEIQQVKAEIEKLGRKAIIVLTDVNDVKQVQALMDKAKETFGRIDILVNNARWTGTAGPGRERGRVRQDHDGLREERILRLPGGRPDHDPAGWRKNRQHRFQLRRSGVQGPSRVRSGQSRGPHLSAALSLEWARQGVTVNVVAPAITETASRKAIIERPGYKEWATNEMLPVGRWNQPEDLVGPVLFLCSRMADMVVGHSLMVDGGWTIH